ncbi:MAG TPA: uridine kinase [Pilimelia sp.]|nr:uridine kinase [Pilimelia sp.]
MRARPITPAALVAELAGRLASGPVRWIRVAVDGAPAAGPDALAEAVADALPPLGRAAHRVRAADFQRPASVRLEFGRTNPDSYYEGWLDSAGLRREVLDPLKPGGTGRVLPTLWDTAADRASRADYLTLPPGAVLLVSGPLLLGDGLPFDLTVHLSMSSAALRRRTPAAEHWTLPAFARYDAEVAPASFADVVVRCDDPRHPAIVAEP